jgi:universal stress protein E
VTKVKRILVVIDPTASSQPAFERSLWLAKRLPAALELTICAYHGGFADQDPSGQAALETALATVLDEQRRALRALAARAVADGLSVNIDARWDYPPLHDAIIRKALNCGADLVLKDTHYHSLLKRSVFSNTDWNLIRACPTNLWLVKPRPTGVPFRVLAAVDPLHENDKPAELDHRLLSAATDLCAALSGDLHVFHAFDIAPVTSFSMGSTTMPVILSEVLTNSVERRHAEALHALTDAHGIDRNKVHLERGETRSLLVALTDSLRADVVVMGAVSRSGLQRLFLGSTAEAVLDKLNCDVLVVKPNRFGTPTEA